jgi:4-hydroxyphenylacetate 3-monooxygenase
MRNSARSIARMYDALHDPKRKEILTSPTDTGSGGYTHKYFRVAHSAADLVAQQGAIADWARMSYGWMGRTADYKAAIMNPLGATADWYGPSFQDNALSWHRRAQESVLFMNHAIVNPPIDRHKLADAVKDVFVHITKETDAGIFVSGAKVVATSSALTHYNFLAQSSATVTEDPSLSVMFILPMNAPGVKMFCRVSYEQTANAAGHPFATRSPRASTRTTRSSCSTMSSSPGRTCWCCAMRRRSSPSTRPPASCTAIASRAARALR